MKLAVFITRPDPRADRLRWGQGLDENAAFHLLVTVDEIDAFQQLITHHRPPAPPASGQYGLRARLAALKRQRPDRSRGVSQLLHVADDADQLRAWDDHIADSIGIGCFSATEAEDRLSAYRAPRTGDLRVTVQSYRGIEFVGAPRLIDVE